MKYMKHYSEKFNMFKSIIKKNNPVIVEVGAHYGEDSVRFVETFPKCKIFCFEADPRNIKIFKKHIKNKRIKLFEYALSDKEATADFYLSHDHKLEKVPPKYDWISLEDYKNYKLSNSGSSSLKKGYSKNVAKISVKTGRYDIWAVENYDGLVDLVWVDVQGAEKSVLMGMGESIKNIKFIWMEYGEKCYQDAMSRSETVDFMNSLNFNEMANFSDNTPQGDILFENRNLEI